MAGIIGMLRIPVAQFPDIVPPQVQVTTRYAGASAAVVEATVAQPLEAQVNGVDQMLYMKSDSSNDGSYGLTVTFQPGTNPDIATVNVNNRVQAAHRAAAARGAARRRDGAEAVVGHSVVHAVLQRGGRGGKPQQDPLFICNYVTINVLDAIAPGARRRPGVHVRRAGLFHADLARYRADDPAGPGAASDVIAAIQAQNVQAAVGRLGAKPTAETTQIQINLQTKGRLSSTEEFGAIILRANPGWLGAAGARCGARRAGGGERRTPRAG
jgi:hypothetical protein